MQLWILMLNDYPIGVYSTKEKAENAAVEDRKRRATARLYYRSYQAALDDFAHNL